MTTSSATVASTAINGARRELGGRALRRLGHRLGEDAHHDRRHRDLAVLAERRPPGQELPDRGAERVDVRGRARLAAVEQLRRRVVEGEAADRRGGRGADRHAGDAEITDRGLAVVGEHDVLRLDVAVHDVAGVGRTERRRAALQHRQRGDRLERAVLGDVLGERTPPAVLHGQPRLVPVHARVVDRHDAGVGGERAHHLALALEPPQRRRVGDVDVEHLQRDPPPGGQLSGLPDDARRTAADAPHELIPGRVVRFGRHGLVQSPSSHPGRPHRPILRTPSQIAVGRVTRGGGGPAAYAFVVTERASAIGLAGEVRSGDPRRV